jgi:hypothetical protein
MDILKQFNIIWKTIKKEERDEYARVSVKMNYDPVYGVKSSTFNGIQFYKE